MTFRSRQTTIFLLLVALLACDSREDPCKGSCGGDHATYAVTGEHTLRGRIIVSDRRWDLPLPTDAPFAASLDARNGSIDIYRQAVGGASERLGCPGSVGAPAGGATDASIDSGPAGDGGAPDAGADAEAGALDAGADGEVDSGGRVDAGAVLCPPDPYVPRQQIARVAFVLPSHDDVETYELEEINAELWFCDSPVARLEPVATANGYIAPGCFEAGKDFVPAVHEPLRGTLEVHAAPAKLDDLRVGESGHAFRYTLRATPRDGSRAEVDLEVSSWEKRRITSCEVY